MSRDRRVLLGTAALAAVAFAVLTIAVAAHGAAVERVDGALSEDARRFALSHVRWRALMSMLTHTADTRSIASLALLATMVLLWLRQWTAVLFLTAAAVAGTAVRLGVLALVARPRPAGRLTAASGWAFPSGHTTSAAVAAGVLIVLVLAFVRRRPLRAGLVLAAGGWAVLVGISRVALLAHWPSDVVGGWLLATAVVTALSLTRLRP